MYKFIIDTDAYSGNFERIMCSYMTCAYDDFTMVGKEFSDTFKDEPITKDILSNIKYVIHPDFDEVETPVLIEKTPNRVNLGNGKIVDIDSIEAKNAKKTYPAYESVAILFKNNPIDFIDVLKKRAYSFANAHNIKILDFRLCSIEENTSFLSLN